MNTPKDIKEPENGELNFFCVCVCILRFDIN